MPVQSQTITTATSASIVENTSLRTNFNTNVKGRLNAELVVSSSAQTISNLVGSDLVVNSVTASGDISSSGTGYFNGLNVADESNFIGPAVFGAGAYGTVSIGDDIIGGEYGMIDDDNDAIIAARYGTVYRYGGNGGQNGGITIDLTGKVGIGTTSPAKSLTVAGDMSASGTLYSNGINSSGDLLVGGGADISISSSVGFGTTINDSSEGFNAFRLQGADTTYFRLDADSQTVGIGEIEDGTAIPKTLTVKGDISASGNSFVKGDSYFSAGAGEMVIGHGWYGGESGLVSTAADESIAIKWSDGSFRYGGSLGGSEALIISASNVGIGTTSPTKKLTVIGDISASGTLYSNDITSNDITSSKITGDANSLTLGYIGDNNIIVEGGGDIFITALAGGIEVTADGNSQLLMSDDIQLRGSGSSPGITIDTSAITLHQHVTASGDISSSGNIYGDGSGLSNLQRPSSKEMGSFTASNANSGYFFEVGAVTCSIQSSSLVACDIGSEFEFFQTSSGNFLFETGSGVTLYSKVGNVKINGQYAGATLKKVRTEEWVLIGDLG